MLLWHRKTVVSECENIARDRFSDVGDGLLASLALGDAAGKAWALGHPEAVLAGINDRLSHGTEATRRFPRVKRVRGPTGQRSEPVADDIRLVA